MTYVERTNVTIHFTNFMIGTLKTTGPTFVQHMTDDLMNRLMMTNVTARWPITLDSRCTGLLELMILTPTCSRFWASTCTVISDLSVVDSKLRNVRRFLMFSVPTLLPVV